MTTYRRSLAFVFCSLLLAGFLFSRAGTFLVSPAQHPIQSDAMIILGGDAGARTLRGIDIYRQGLSRHIILTGA